MVVIDVSEHYFAIADDVITMYIQEDNEQCMFLVHSDISFKLRWICFFYIFKGQLTSKFNLLPYIQHYPCITCVQIWELYSNW